jgi:ferredoxin-NADP reductase
MNFNRNMLPLLGVNYHYFNNEKDALAFADWAERETRRSPRPCTATVIVEDDRPADERYGVKVSNW